MVTSALNRAVPNGLMAGAPLSRIQGPADALGLVTGHLMEAESVLRTLVESNVAEITSISRYLVDAGGKRLRPALTALGGQAVGYSKPISRLMCVGELIHLGSLLHDDVVDGAEQRRGKPSAHLQYGNAATILSGEFSLARAMLLASEEGGGRAAQELARDVTEMAEGEVLQLRWAGHLSCSIETYLAWVERHSAALISWCVAATAWSQEDVAAAEALASFGRGVGIAFQITDDVLDYRNGTGKSVGTDLRQRKVTLPLLAAMDADPEIRARLESDELEPAHLEEMMGRIEKTGALDHALAMAKRRVDESSKALLSLPSSEGREALAVLGHYLVERVL